jgi:hypothetical protein
MDGHGMMALMALMALPAGAGMPAAHALGHQ